MNTQRLALTCLFLTISFTPASYAQEPKVKVLAGWMGVFPEGFNYERKFEKPKVTKETWQQSAVYEWSGGRIETVQVTLLRDAGEAKKHAFDNKKPAPDNVKKIPFGERVGWEYPGGKLVIHLAADRLMIVEALTWKQFQSDLSEFAKRFPLDACAKALENPPRTDFSRTVEMFRRLEKGMSLARVREWVGEAEKDIGSGIHILTYRLDDGTRVLIGFPDFNRLIYVKHEDKDRKVTDLAK